MIHFDQVSHLVGDDVVNQRRWQMDQSPVQADAATQAATTPPRARGRQAHRWYGQRKSMAVFGHPSAKPVERTLTQGPQQYRCIRASAQMQLLHTISRPLPLRPPPAKHAQPDGFPQYRQQAAIGKDQALSLPTRCLGRQAIKQPLSMTTDKMLDSRLWGSMRRGNTNPTMIQLQGQGAPHRAPHHQIDSTITQIDTGRFFGGRRTRTRRAAQQPADQVLSSH